MEQINIKYKTIDKADKLKEEVCRQIDKAFKENGITAELSHPDKVVKKYDNNKFWIDIQFNRKDT